MSSLSVLSIINPKAPSERSDQVGSEKARTGLLSAPADHNAPGATTLTGGLPQPGQ